MSIERLNNWVKSKQGDMEDALLSSAEQYYSNYSSKGHFPFDAFKAGKEQYLLGQGRDLCYDRPSIGFVYSMWYHPKRINTFLKYFVNLIYDSREEPNIEIFDLGAGTGAVQWAVGIVYQGMKELGIKTPKIRIISIDTSPFMLIYNGNYSWKSFTKKFAYTEEIKIDYRINSWSDLSEDKCSNIWLCASYLFDHTDNADSISDEFNKLVKQYKPNKILLLSSSGKNGLVDKVGAYIAKENYQEMKSSTFSQLLSGSLTKLSKFRFEISQTHSLEFSGTPQWNIDTLYGKVLVNIAPKLALDFPDLNLFIQPEKDRTKIKLTQQQREASELMERPSIIIGPAGCGKSVVLTQKVKNILEDPQNLYNPNTKILVTTFNKGLVRYLSDWIFQLLDQTKITRAFYTNFEGRQQDHSYFTIKGSLIHNIEVLHFDVLPTRIGGVAWKNCSVGGADIEAFHFQRMQSAISDFIEQSKIKGKEHEKILNPEFLLDEYQRIVYGMQCGTEKQYQNIERTGRGGSIQLRYNSLRRKIIWGVIMQYLRALKKDNLESFIIRRHKFLKKLKEKGFQKKFTHIIVDELQDCTSGDYEIFYTMLDNPNNFVLAGDLAQSIQLGGSFYIPRSDDKRMKNFKKLPLEGSFRLPFRVSECIRPLSEIINKKFGEREGINADIINPYKGAPPGARPIFVFAKDLEEAGVKIKEIFNSYSKAFKIDKVSIFEKDKELEDCIRAHGINAESEIILRAKGLEKACVLWSTRVMVETQTEIEEFVYTIITRTVTLLIILVVDEVREEYREIIKLLRDDRLIFWNRQSEEKFHEIKSNAQTNAPIEDSDTSDNVTQSEDVEIDVDIFD